MRVHLSQKSLYLDGPTHILGCGGGGVGLGVWVYPRVDKGGGSEIVHGDLLGIENQKP